MSAGKPLFIIDADGAVLEKYVPSLPSSGELRLEFFDGADIEHVAVQWQGCPAHAFVRARFHGHQLPVNLKGSAIYQNYTRGVIGFGQYKSLRDDPGVYVLRDFPLIFGRMVFWPARAPEWEPVGCEI